MSDNELKLISELTREIRALREVQERQQRPLINGRIGVALEKIRFNPSTVAAIVISVASSTWFIARQVESMTADTWKASHMRTWQRRTELQNMNWHGADIDQIKRDLDKP